MHNGSLPCITARAVLLNIQLEVLNKFKQKRTNNEKTITAVMLMAVSIASASAGEITQKAAALLKAAPDKEFTMMVVPTAGNFISNKIIVTSLKAGTESQSSQQISTILQRPSPVQLAITGENDAVAEATLEKALSSLKGKPLPPHEVAFIGDKEYEEALSNKAAEVGIKLIYVPYP
jgi:glycerol-3-phosphate dehydrogenase